MHAVDTYGQFVDENEERLKKIPAPPIAVHYYRTGDLYMFDKFQTDQKDKPKEVPVGPLHALGPARGSVFGGTQCFVVLKGRGGAYT